MRHCVLGCFHYGHTMNDSRPCGGCEKEGCAFCQLFHNDPQYHALWTDAPIPEPVKQEGIDLDCVKRVFEEHKAQAATMPNPETGPSILRKVFNFGQAVVIHAASGFQQATKEEIERRVSICESCVGPSGFFNPETRVCTHKSCGCNVDRKTPWLEQKCPVGKW